MPGMVKLHCLALAQVIGQGALRASVPAALGRGLALVRSAIRETLEATGGDPVDSASRGHLATFDAPVDACRFAVALQEALLRQPWPSTLLVRPEAGEERGDEGTVRLRGLRVRVGVHRGLARLEGGRVRGPAIYQLARLTAAAHGGQGLISDPIRHALGDDEARALGVVDLGGHRLTGVDGAHRLYQVSSAGLREREVPDPWSQDTRRTNLVPDDDFVGRQQDVAALTELFALGVRNLTVVGPDGSGKSRLIRQFALLRRADPSVTGGVWLAAPAATSVGAVVRTVAIALGLRLDLARTVEEARQRVGYALADRGPCLVVVDGLRAPDPDVARTVEAWMRLAPEARFVVSAPERLRSRGEVAYAIGDLGLPSGPGDRQADAWRLFASRAHTISTTFAAESSRGAGELVTAVGGSPRAIRLLAGLVDRLTLDELRSALTGPRARPLREVAWSALDGGERAVLAVCALHQGSFEAVEAPASAPRVDVHEVLEQLDQRGWLRVSPNPSAPDVRRYALAPGLRSFVRDHTDRDTLASLRAQRSRHLLGEGEAWLAAAARPDAPEVVAHLAVEWPNLVQVVLDGLASAGEDGLALAMRGLGLLRPVIAMRGPAYVGLDLVQRVCARAAELVADSEQARAQGPLVACRLLGVELQLAIGAGAAASAELEAVVPLLEGLERAELGARGALLRGRVLAASRDEAASVAFTEAEDGFREADAPRMAAVARSWRGERELAVGRYREAEALLQQAIDALRPLGATSDAARAVGWLALLYRRAGRFREARDLYRELILLLVEEGDARRESHARTDLAALEYHLGRLEEAEEGLQDASVVARRIGDRDADARASGYGGLVAIALGQPERARERLLSALAARRDLGDAAGEGRVTGHLGLLHHLTDQLEAAARFYTQALELLEHVGDRRLQALFAGWLAALLAQQGDLEGAAAQAARAQACLAEASDPQVAATLEHLSGVLAWVEADQRVAAGDGEGARELQAAVRARLASAQGRDPPLPGEARLAVTLVERLVRRAS